jgi:hypothetical protein
MLAVRTLKRRILSTASLTALAFASFAGFGTLQARAAAPLSGHTIPGVVGTVPALGGSIGNVITTTCGDSPVIVLSVIVCQLELPEPRA